MKKITINLIVLTIIFSVISLSFAQTAKVITLKDGSVLKGKVLELKEGTYTLETDNLGNITIAESDILSIASPQHPSLKKGDENQKAQLKNQVEQLQGNILGDKEIMSDIQEMAEDEEIQAILSDPKLLDDMMSFDQDKIEQNDDVQDLMNNPKMQQLMNKIQQKIPAQ